MNARHYWNRTERNVLARRELGKTKVATVPLWRLRAMLKRRWSMTLRYKRRSR